MSDLAATSCCNNDCGCAVDNCGGNNCSWLWIIILLCCCGGNGFGGNSGCGGDDCGCNIIWILLLLCCCGGNGFGC